MSLTNGFSRPWNNSHGIIQVPGMPLHTLNISSNLDDLRGYYVDSKIQNETEDLVVEITATR
jgi:hypothetical protein